MNLDFCVKLHITELAGVRVRRYKPMYFGFRFLGFEGRLGNYLACGSAAAYIFDFVHASEATLDETR